MIGAGAGAGGGGGGGRPGLPLQPRGAAPGHAEEELHGQVPSSDKLVTQVSDMQAKLDNQCCTKFREGAYLGTLSEYGIVKPGLHV